MAVHFNFLLLNQPRDSLHTLTPEQTLTAQIMCPKETQIKMASMSVLYFSLPYERMNGQFRQSTSLEGEAEIPRDLEGAFL